MSIPLVQEATKDAINTSIIAIKRNIERINMLLGLVDSGSPDLSGLATKQELEDAITQVETDLAPVDEVTVNNMQSVTSNAVAQALNGLIKYKDIVIDFSSLSFIQYGSGGYYCNIPVSSFLSNWSELLAITLRWWTALDCRGFYLGFDSLMENITIIVETYSSSATIRARIVYL